jgi:glutamate transport system permease protein
VAIRVATAISLAAIAVAAYLAWRQFAINGQWEWRRWEQFTEPAILRFLAGAFWRTIAAAGAGALIALPLGVVLALGRLHTARPLRWAAVAVIEFFRAVPLLLIMYIFFFALPRSGINPPLFWKLVIPIGLCEGAVIAEVFRAGILALPAGQSEAGAAVGLTGAQTFWRIVFPQAVRMVVPSLVAQIVILLKDTTLGYAVSYFELQNSAQLLTNRRPESLVQTYLVITGVYVAINVAISAAARQLDRRWAQPAASRGRADRPDEIIA